MIGTQNRLLYINRPYYEILLQYEKRKYVQSAKGILVHAKGEIILVQSNCKFFYIAIAILDYYIAPSKAFNLPCFIFCIISLLLFLTALSTNYCNTFCIFRLQEATAIVDILFRVKKSDIYRKEAIMNLCKSRLRAYRLLS